MKFSPVLTELLGAGVFVLTSELLDKRAEHFPWIGFYDTDNIDCKDDPYTGKDERPELTQGFSNSFAQPGGTNIKVFAVVRFWKSRSGPISIFKANQKGWEQGKHDLPRSNISPEWARQLSFVSLDLIAGTLDPDVIQAYSNTYLSQTLIIHGCSMMKADQKPTERNQHRYYDQ